MKQLHYGRHSLSGNSGAAQATRGWATSIAAAGGDVELAVDAATRVLPCPEGLLCRSIRHIGTKKLAWPVSFGRHLAAFDLLVVHAGLRPHTAAGARRAYAAGKPYIVSTHGIYLEGARRRSPRAKWVAERVFERAYLQRASAIHTYFEEEIADLQALGVERPLIVAPPGIEVATDARWDGGSGGYLLWLGRFDPVQKGLDLLLDAMALLPAADRPQLRLHGTDWRGQKAKVAAGVTAHGLSGSVLLGDPVYGSAKWQLMSAARGFVYPSRYEAYGMSLAEAASLGIPTLATPYALSRFLHERGGVLMADATPRSLALGIQELVSKDAAELGANAARVARSELSWHASASSWMEQASVVLDTDLRKDSST